LTGEQTKREETQATLSFESHLPESEFDSAGVIPAVNLPEQCDDRLH